MWWWQMGDDALVAGAGLVCQHERGLTETPLGWGLGFKRVEACTPPVCREANFTSNRRAPGR
jgi:hypothetical protein